MAKINFITGGVSSGKSRWAVSYFAACDNVLYMCTAHELNKEIADRIKWNGEHNFVEWIIMTDFSLDDVEIDKHKFLIFDDLATYTSLTIEKMCPSEDDMTPEKKKEIQTKIIEDISNLISRVQVNDATMTIISSEMGFSVNPVSKEQKFFRDVLGSVNQRIANLSSEVFLSVSGVQFKIK